MKKFFILLTMLTSLNAFTKTHDLLVVTSSEDSNYSRLELETDDSTGEALNLIVRDYNKKNVLTAEDEFSYDEINDGGAILSESDGHEVVVISKIQVDPTAGGKVMLDLLGNALTGKRLNYELKLVRSADGFKIADASSGKVINSLHFIARKILGKAVGIKEVRTK